METVKIAIVGMEASSMMSSKGVRGEGLVLDQRRGKEHLHG